jgi:flagellar M-ring protein FliF
MADSTQTALSMPLRFWQNLSIAKKVSMVFFMVSFLVAASILVHYLTTPKMGVLFRALNPETAASVIARLDEMNVPYRISGGGTEIQVPQNRMDELRISLSSDGSLYGSGLGFELFDQTKLGVSEAERRLNYQRALQVELQRTIGQIEGVSQARVHLVIPEPNVFLRDSSATTASVVLKTNALQQLRKDQIAGIVYLVAGSVENLAPENVTVIDTQGRILSNLSEQSTYPGELNVGGTLAQLEIKRSFEKELEDRVQHMLERVLGPGTVVAMVTADLDFDAREITEIIYGEPVLRSSSKTEMDFDGSGTNAGGNAGTDSNIPGYPTGGGANEESRYTHIEEIQNYEISETLTHTIRAPGKVNQLSASIIYDNSKGTLSATQMESIEQLVSSALGMAPERNDSVNIASLGFDRSYLEETREAMEQSAKTDRLYGYIRYALLALATIGGILLLFAIARTLQGYIAEQIELQKVNTIKSQRAAEQQLHQQASGGDEKHQNRVRNITQQNPETAISLLKMWLMEDQR